MAERPPRGPCTFKQRDVCAAIKAARSAGETGMIRVEIDPSGKIVIITSRQNAPELVEANPWDEMPVVSQFECNSP